MNINFAGPLKNSSYELLSESFDNNIDKKEFKK